MIRKLMVFAFILAAPWAQASIGDCWPSHDIEPLTLSRIMYQFRDNLSIADEVIVGGLEAPQTVPLSALELAQASLRMAIACTQVVLDDQTEQFLPSAAAELTGEAKEAYVQAYWGYMNQFQAALVAYANLVQALVALPAEARDFEPAFSHSMRVREVANQAHWHL